MDVVDQLSDIDWLPSDGSGDDNDESWADVNRPATAADDDDDDDDLLSIDVQDSPLVGASLVQVISTRPPASPSNVCMLFVVNSASFLERLAFGIHSSHKVTPCECQMWYLHCVSKNQTPVTF